MLNDIKKKLNERGVSDATIDWSVKFLTWLVLVKVIIFIFYGSYDSKTKHYTGGLFDSFEYNNFYMIKNFLFVSINVLLCMIYKKLCDLYSLLKNQSK